MKLISITRGSTFLILFLHFSIIRAQDICPFIKSVQSYQDSVKIYFDDDTYIIDTLTFQLSSYLKTFDRLKKSPERRFEIYYQFTILDGAPIIYTVPNDFNVESYIEDRIIKSPELKHRINGDLEPKELRRLLFYEFVTDSLKRAFNYVTPEDSAEGYLQYLFFYIMGEQFALFWHSLYFEKRIICTKQDKEDISKRYFNNESYDVDKRELKKLEGMKVTPIIELTKSHCHITWYELETHRGLYRRTYEIERKGPFKIQEVKSNKIMDIGLRFIY